MISIKGYGCVSSAGQGASIFWSSLSKGVDNSEPADIGKWSEDVLKYLELNEITLPRFCQFNDRSIFSTTLDAVLDKLTKAYDEAIKQEKEINFNKVGVIFASTKGITEDVIWSINVEGQKTYDTHSKILKSFCERKRISPLRTLCISNACASSHAALYTATKWIKNGIVDDVIVIAADMVGPFVYSGFASLKSLCSTKTKPFDKDRDGLQLGDGAAVLILGNKKRSDEKGLCIAGIELDSEGFAITRPAIDGKSLLSACESVLRSTKKVPDIIIAHGTGTIANDIIEDTVISALFSNKDHRPYVTGTKWCIGHTLGASGCMDLIAACKILSNQICFGIANSNNLDHSMKANYIIGNSQLKPAYKISSVLVNSLGFGGYHASMMVCMGD